LLTDDKADVYELFVENEEILVYKNESDLYSTASKLLNDEARLKRIRENGIKKILSEHTYFIRIKKILPQIEMLRYETIYFNKLFELFDNEKYEEIEKAALMAREEDIKINTIYYYFFITLILLNKYGKESKEYKEYKTKMKNITTKNVVANIL